MGGEPAHELAGLRAAGVSWPPPLVTTRARLAYVLQVPCSWGALYFSTYFEEFLAYYDVRTALPFYNFTEELHQAGGSK